MEGPGQENENPKVLSLLNAVRNRTFMGKEIMSFLGLRSRDNFRNNYLLPAISKGFLTMLYPDVPKHRKQAYYLTETGLSLIE